MKAFKTTLAIVAFLIVAILFMFGPPVYCMKKKDEVNRIKVPGVVLAKGSEDHTHKHSSTRHWLLSIKPDNPSYKIYDVDVSFSTYCSLNEGSHCAFVVEKHEVGLEENDFYDTFILWWIIGIVTFAVTGLIYCFVELEQEMSI